MRERMIEVEEAIDGVRFRVSPGSFFQVNSEMVGKIFAYLAPRLESVREVLDLYSGAGTFALYFARAILPSVEHKAQQLAEEDRTALDIPEGAFATV